MGKLISLIGNLIALAAALGLMARYVPPQVFWPPAIMALLLPGLLLFTLFFIAFQLYRRSWRSIVFPVLILAAALPTLGRLFAWPRSQPASNEATARIAIVTGNQRVFRDDAGQELDSSRVTRAVRRFNADILLVQEARTERWDQNYIDEITREGGYGRRHQPSGTFVATYAAELEPITSDFTEPNEYNGYVVSDVTTEIGKIRIINAHLESNQISGMTGGIGSENAAGERISTFGRMLKGYGRMASKRANQAEAIRQLIKESPFPVIVGGDFNDVPSSYTYNRILTPRLRDAWSQAGAGLGTTFTGPLPGLRIDYLMVDTSLTILTVERLAADWSDHRPVRVVVTR